MRDYPESIFFSTIRSFFTSLAAIVGILIGIALIVFAFMFLSTPTVTPEKTEIVIAPDADGKRDLLPASVPVILRVNFKGVIGEPMLDSDAIENVLLDSRDTILSGNRVKGVLLYMNTPGGTASDADNIYRALMAYKKKYNVPVYAFVDGLCASGGVYVTSSADRIYATPSSVVGSVGVILGPNFNFTGTMDKMGVQALTITQGKDKDSLNPFRPWKPDEDKPIRAITESLYERFVAVVAAARPNLTREKLVNDYGARIFISSEAKELGYIDDADSDYSAALRDLVKASGIPDNTPYQVFQLHPKLNLFSELGYTKLSLLKGKITHVFQIGPNLTSEMSGKFLYLYQP